MKANQINRLKKLAIDAYSKGQLPSAIVRAILDLELKEEFASYATFLMAQTEHFMRVPKYYKKYKDVNDLANAEFTDLLHKWKKERGYIDNDWCLN